MSAVSSRPKKKLVEFLIANPTHKRKAGAISQSCRLNDVEGRRTESQCTRSCRRVLVAGASSAAASLPPASHARQAVNPGGFPRPALCSPRAIAMGPRKRAKPNPTEQGPESNTAAMPPPRIRSESSAASTNSAAAPRTQSGPGDASGGGSNGSQSSQKSVKQVRFHRPKLTPYYCF